MSEYSAYVVMNWALRENKVHLAMRFDALLHVTGRLAGTGGVLVMNDAVDVARLVNAPLPTRTRRDYLSRRPGRNYRSSTHYQTLEAMTPSIGGVLDVLGSPLLPPLTRAGPPELPALAW